MTATSANGPVITGSGTRGPTSSPSTRTTAGRGSLSVRTAAGVVVGAVVLNVALALLLRAVTGTSDEFLPLQPGPVAVATLVGVLAGFVLYLVLQRLVARPGRVFAGLVVVGASLSLGGPASLLGASAVDMPGVTDVAALSLVPLHLLPAAVVLRAVLRGPAPAAGARQ